MTIIDFATLSLLDQEWGHFFSRSVSSSETADIVHNEFLAQ